VYITLDTLAARRDLRDDEAEAEEELMVMGRARASARGQGGDVRGPMDEVREDCRLGINMVTQSPASLETEKMLEASGNSSRRKRPRNLETKHIREPRFGWTTNDKGGKEESLRTCMFLK